MKQSMMMLIAVASLALVAPAMADDMNNMNNMNNGSGQTMGSGMNMGSTTGGDDVINNTPSSGSANSSATPDTATGDDDY